MNKIAKASIATAAGVALLLGGAGTFASWNGTATTIGAPVSAGNLVVASDSTAGTWTANGSKTPLTISDYAVSPGDTLTFTKTMQIAAEGDTLQAELALTGGSIVASDITDAADQALAGQLTSTAVLTAVGEGITSHGGSFTVVPAAGAVSQDVTVTVTITFPTGADAKNTAMKGSVDLSALTVTLTQATV